MGRGSQRRKGRLHTTMQVWHLRRKRWRRQDRKSLSLEAVLRKSWPGWWCVLQTKTLVKIILCFIRWVCITIPIMLSHWLGAPHQKWGLVWMWGWIQKASCWGCQLFILSQQEMCVACFWGCHSVQWTQYDRHT